MPAALASDGGLHPVLSDHAAARAEAHFFRVGFIDGHQNRPAFYKVDSAFTATMP